MKAILTVLLLCLLLPMTAHAQTAEPTAPVDSATMIAVFDPPEALVDVESAFIRALPTRDSEVAGSVFQGTRLEVVGRNADGQWFQMRRPVTEVVLGWMDRSLLEYEFEFGILPITDGVTGLLGTEPVTDPYGVSAVTLAEVVLRAEATSGSAEITRIPIDSLVPVLLRDPNDGWYQVNYLGYTGWVAAFLMREPDDIANVPRLEGEAAADSIAFEIIPPEIQLAQVDRLREFISARRELAVSLSDFWYILEIGEIAPCSPPGFVREQYEASFQDFKELPELRRYLPTLDTALVLLNESIETFQPCGVYTPVQISEAYADAINAKVFFDAVSEQLDNLEEFVIR